VLDLARSLGGRPLSVLIKIRLPNALPSIFAGMKVAISLALVGTIVGEFVSSSAGLGYIIVVSQGTYNTPRIFAALLMLAIMGTILFFIIDRVERIAIPWHVSHRGKE
jgi:NitT/TauT family transport system permease protein